jgi:hypothetical protein
VTAALVEGLVGGIDLGARVVREGGRTIGTAARWLAERAYVASLAPVTAGSVMVLLALPNFIERDLDEDEPMIYKWPGVGDASPDHESPTIRDQEDLEDMPQRPRQTEVPPQHINGWQSAS